MTHEGLSIMRTIFYRGSETPAFSPDAFDRDGMKAWASREHAFIRCASNRYGFIGRGSIRHAFYKPGWYKALVLLLFFMLLLFSGQSLYAQQVELKVVSDGSIEDMSQWRDQVEGTYRDSSSVVRHLQKSLAGLYSRGYLAASFDSLGISGDTLKAFLHTGRKYRWGRLRLDVSGKQLEGRLPDPGRMGSYRILNLEELKVYQEQVLAFLENRGYPFASVRLLRQGRGKGDTLDAVFRVNTGTRYVIDSIYIKGDNPVSRKYLYPFLGLRPGMVYDESKIRDIPAKIDNLSFLRQIRDFELEFSRGNRVRLFLYLERTRSNRAEGTMGLLPGGQGGVRFTGQVDVGLWNVFRRGEQLAMQWRNPEPATQELQLKADLPYLLFQSMGLHGNFEWFRKDTSYLTRSARVGVPFHISGYSRIEVFGDFEASSVLSGSGAAGGYEDYGSRLYGVEYLYNKLDYRLNPGRGLRVATFASAGKRQVRGEGDSRTSVEAGLDLSWFHPLYRSWVMHLANKSRFRQAWSEEETAGIPENGLYRFGGFGSLRGFDENALLASSYTIFTVEARYLLSRNSNVYAFFDWAWYRKQTPSQMLSDTPYGFGVGAHIDSGMGIFYLSYALGHQFDQPIDPGSGRIHLGYVSKF